MQALKENRKEERRDGEQLQYSDMPIQSIEERDMPRADVPALLFGQKESESV